MELPRKILEQIAFNTRPQTEKHMLINMDKNTHEEHLYQSLQTNNKQYKIAITFVTGYNGIFNVTNKSNIFSFTKSISDDDGFTQITIPPGAYKIESLNNETKTNIIDKKHYTESKYPFTIKPNFSKLWSIMELSTQGPVNTFVPDASIRDLLAFKKTTKYEEYNLSPILVDVLSLDNMFLECDIAQGMIFKVNRSGIFHKFTMDVDPGTNT